MSYHIYEKEVTYEDFNKLKNHSGITRCGLKNVPWDWGGAQEGFFISDLKKFAIENTTDVFNVLIDCEICKKLAEKELTLILLTKV